MCLLLNYTNMAWLWKPFPMVTRLTFFFLLRPLEESERASERASERERERERERGRERERERKSEKEWERVREWRRSLTNLQFFWLKFFLVVLKVQVWLQGINFVSKYKNIFFSTFSIRVILMAQLGIYFPTTLYCGAGIRTHVTSVTRVVPNWNLWRTLYWLSYSASTRRRVVQTSHDQTDRTFFISVRT